MTARLLRDDDAGRAEAIQLLRDGGIVAIPTDTVYGIGVDLAAPDGIARLFAAKRRPPERAITLLIADAGQAQALAEWPPAADALAGRFWPGGLTLVLRQRAGVRLPPELTGGARTIGLRLPDHACPRALAAALGPMPVTSANVSGLPEARDAAEIVEQLGEVIDGIVDGGPASGGPASTVVDCAETTVRVLRVGAIPEQEIAACLLEAGLPAPAPAG